MFPRLQPRSCNARKRDITWLRMAMGSGRYRRWGCVGAAERPPARPVGVVGLGGAGLAAGATAGGGTLTTAGAAGVVGFGAAGGGAIAIWGPFRVNCAALQGPPKAASDTRAGGKSYFNLIKVAAAQRKCTSHPLRCSSAKNHIRYKHGLPDEEDLVAALLAKFAL